MDEETVIPQGGPPASSVKLAVIARARGNCARVGWKQLALDCLERGFELSLRAPCAKDPHSHREDWKPAMAKLQVTCFVPDQGYVFAGAGDSVVDVDQLAAGCRAALVERGLLT